jgi:hypothetical protein
MQFKVPAYDEDPSEEFIEHLHNLTIEWDGDPSGLTFNLPEGDVIAEPGDTVTFNSDGSVSVTKGTQNVD